VSLIDLRKPHLFCCWCSGSWFLSSLGKKKKYGSPLLGPVDWCTKRSEFSDLATTVCLFVWGVLQSPSPQSAFYRQLWWFHEPHVCKVLSPRKCPSFISLYSQQEFEVGFILTCDHLLFGLAYCLSYWFFGGSQSKYLLLVKLRCTIRKHLIQSSIHAEGCSGKHIHLSLEDVVPCILFVQLIKHPKLNYLPLTVWNMDTKV
jgi:hypothetical protein